MQRDVTATQAAKQLGVTPRALQIWCAEKACPHDRNPRNQHYRFDVGEVRAWAVKKGLLTASADSKLGKQKRNNKAADSKSKPEKSKSKGGKAKSGPPADPPAPEADTSPEGRRKTAFEILAKIPGLLSELNVAGGSLAASQVAMAIKSAEATATAMLRRLDLEAERDEQLIDRNKAIRLVVEIGQAASANSRAAVVDLPDRLFEDLVASGLKVGAREDFIRVCRATVRDAEDRRMLELADAVARAEARLNGRSSI